MTEFASVEYNSDQKGGMYVPQYTDYTADVEIFLEIPASGDYHYSTYIFATVSAIDMTIALGTSGGRAMSANMDILGLIPTIGIIELVHAFKGLVIAPQDETYHLVIAGIEIPLVWFTVRKRLYNSAIQGSVVCNVPLQFFDVINPLVGSIATINRRAVGITKEFLTGFLSIVSNNNKSTELSIVQLDEPARIGSITLENVQYIRNINEKTTIRLPPHNNVFVGNVVITNTTITNVKNTTLHISDDQSFLEVG